MAPKIIIFVVIGIMGLAISMGIFVQSQSVSYNETNVYDFNSTVIQQAINEIEPISPTTYLKLKNTVSYVHNNVEYKSQPGDKCLSESASDVLTAKESDCTGMSKVIVAILRGMNVESRIAGGCVSKYYTCTHIYAITGELIERPFVVYNQDGSYSGGFHEWVEAKVGNTWYILDGTDGSMTKADCKDYWKSQNPADNDLKDMCYESNNEILKSCSSFSII